MDTAPPSKLPRGRHGLTREQVVTSQRERLLLAMAEAVAENGYAKTSVAQVLKRAGVSRESFYEQFSNKEECFLAAYDAAATILLEVMAGGLGAEPGPDHDPSDLIGSLSRLLEAYLGALASEPAVARTFFVEVYAAGEAALARRVEIQARFVEAVIGIIGAQDDEERFACEAIVAAISALVTQRVCAGRFEEIEDLHEPIVRLVRSVLADRA